MRLINHKWLIFLLLLSSSHLFALSPIAQCVIDFHLNAISCANATDSLSIKDRDVNQASCTNMIAKNRKTCFEQIYKNHQLGGCALLPPPNIEDRKLSTPPLIAANCLTEFLNGRDNCQQKASQMKRAHRHKMFMQCFNKLKKLTEECIHKIKMPNTNMPPTQRYILSGKPYWKTDDDIRVGNTVWACISDNQFSAKWIKAKVLQIKKTTVLVSSNNFKDSKWVNNNYVLNVSGKVKYSNTLTKKQYALSKRIHKVLYVISPLMIKWQSQRKKGGGLNNKELIQKFRKVLQPYFTYIKLRIVDDKMYLSIKDADINKTAKLLLLPEFDHKLKTYWQCQCLNDYPKKRLPEICQVD